MIEEKKKTIATIAEKNRIIDNIIGAMVKKEHFLLLGHRSPDEDCISALVGFALILSKFGKTPVIFLAQAMNRQYEYLLNICKFNSIQIATSFGPEDGPIDAIAILDTPKPEMLNANAYIDSLFADDSIIKIEIDHHIGADGAYIGQPGYRLVLEASSAAELVGHLALKLQNRPEILAQNQVTELFSRNVVLALLTGIISDTNMGQYIKSRRERRYYEIFSNMFNSMLAKETVKDTNFADMKEIFAELTRLSNKEESFFRFVMKKRQRSKSLAYVLLEKRVMDRIWKDNDVETVVSVSRNVTDKLAEESGKLGMVAYYDNPEKSDLVQFRVRRSQDYKGFDLRTLLTLLSIENGGGHEGAIGFRIPKRSLKDLKSYAAQIVPKIDEVVG